MIYGHTHQGFIEEKKDTSSQTQDQYHYQMQHRTQLYNTRRNKIILKNVDGK